MIRNSIFTIIISIITIFIMHFLYEYFKQNLTTPKIKDLISKPKKEYENIYNIIKDGSKGQSTSLDKDSRLNNSNTINQNTINTNTINPNMINPNTINKDLIKDELKNFFNDLNTANDTNKNLDKNQQHNLVYENYNNNENFTNF